MSVESVPLSNGVGIAASSFDELLDWSTCASVYEFFFAAASSNPHRSSKSSIVANEAAIGVMPLPCATRNTFLGIIQNESNIDASGSRLRKYDFEGSNTSAPL